MIIDAHQHFWNLDEVGYYWASPDIGPLYRNFLPSELCPLIEANGVEKTIAVQATSSMKETAWLLKQAEENAFVAGVVAWVDLKEENLEDELAELKQHVKFIGVRHQAEDEPDREWILQESVLSGLEKAEKSGIAFDALLKHDQVWQLDTVCTRCPELNIVLDHCAKPQIERGEFAEWADHIRHAAKLPIYCKLSGLFTEADKKHWKTDEIRRYSDHILEMFGEDRIMFGSDWPVSTLASDYARTVTATIELLSDLTVGQKRKILCENAIRFYKLKIG